jgi:hypothetical protein
MEANRAAAARATGTPANRTYSSQGVANLSKAFERSDPAKHRRQLEDFYEHGRAALRKYEKLKKNREAVYGKLAELTASEKNRLFEARKLASKYETLKDFRAWCGYGAKEGSPLTISHVRQLSRVANSAKRNALARRCVKQSWSARRLDREIAAILPGRQYSGRRLEVPDSDRQLLVCTERLLRNLIRWINSLEAENSKTNRPHLARLDGDFSRQLKKFKAQATGLELLCTEKREQLAKARSKKGGPGKPTRTGAKK